MNLSPQWVSELAKDGHDAIHWRDVGATAAPDTEIAAWAAQEARCVLTADLDFAAMVAMGNLAAPTVVQLRFGTVDPDESGAFVRHSIAGMATQLKGGAILTIDGRQVRFRPGPAQFSPMDES